MSRNLLALVVLAMATPGCNRAADPAPQQNRFELTTEAGEARELCFESAAGDEVVYRFEASAPLGFNLHYHVEEEVFYPVPEHETAAEKGQYIVPADQPYCLMWTNNGAADVTLTAELYGAGPVTAY